MGALSVRAQQHAVSSMHFAEICLQHSPCPPQLAVRLLFYILFSMLKLVVPA